MSASTPAEDVIVERGRPVEMRDGCRLSADVYRPAQGSTELPRLLLRLPYDRRLPNETVYAHPSWYAGNGFVVAVVDCRGTGASDGEFTAFVDEASDGYDAIRWLAELDGHRAPVGTYGASYAGYAQLLAAAEDPPGLAAIAPAISGADVARDWFFRGGALSLGFTAWWAAQLLWMVSVRRDDHTLAAAAGAVVADPRDWFATAEPADLAPIASHFPQYRRWLDLGPDESAWADVSVAPRRGGIRVPTLSITGWYDIFNDGTISNATDLASQDRDVHQLLVGPWGHVPWSDRLGSEVFGDAVRDVDVDQVQVQFFRRHLLDDPGGTAATDPAVRYFVLFGGRWQTAETWPPEDSRFASAYLSSTGTADNPLSVATLSWTPPTGSQPPDRIVVDPANPVINAGGRSCCLPEIAPIGPADQSVVENRRDVLVYTAAPLDKTVEVAGQVRMYVWVTCTAPTFDVVGRLCRVRDGVSTNVAEGIHRVVTTPIDGAPKAVEVEVNLGHIAFELARNDVLRLQVCGSSFPSADVNAHGGDPRQQATRTIATTSVWHDLDYPSRLDVPIRHIPPAASTEATVGSEVADDSR